MNLLTVVCFFYTFSTILADPIAAKGCTLSIESLPTTFPLIIAENSIDFVYPDFGTQDITLASGDSIELSCPQSTLNLTDTTTAIAICSANGEFTIDSAKIAITSVACKKKPTNTARYTGAKCSQNMKEIQIGFQIDTARFLNVITVCFDEAKRDPLYAYYNLTKYIDSYDTTVDRPSFSEENFYNLSEKLNTLYTKTLQRETINGQLELPSNSEEIIGAGNFYLAKGHLTAKTDFVYGAAQTATFHFVNTAPQWQNFNSMNWLRTENSVRSVASSRQQDMIVYTGIYGILTLADNENGNEQGLYLFVDGNTRAVTIPELFWKMVYEPESKKALVILGINNPYLQTPKTICNDISEEISWLEIDGRDNIEAGYIYSCAYDEVSQIIKGFPILNVNGVLN